MTDVVRRHPASLAQTALTLDHLTGGRFILGVGAGEALNLAPFGVANRRPLSRLDEGLEIMRLLMDTPEPVNFDGEHFTLRGAALGLRPLGDRPPPVWVAAHRPRGLAVAGRRADGWLPLATDPGEYARMLAAVRDAAAAAGRPADAVTPGLYARVVVAESREAAQAAIDGSLLMRFIALTRPAEAFAARGAAHPLGEDAFGLTSFLPTAYGRAEALRLAESVPAEVVRDIGHPRDARRRRRRGGRVREPRRAPRAAHQHDPAGRAAARGVERGAARRHGRGPARREPGARVRRHVVPLALSLAAAAALAAAPAASGATRTLTLEGWHDRALAFSGRQPGLDRGRHRARRPAPHRRLARRGAALRLLPRREPRASGWTAPRGASRAPPRRRWPCAPASPG